MDLKIENVCSNCFGMTKLNERYDAYYCEVCDMWTETVCEHKDCYYCKDRPAKPSDCIQVAEGD